MKIISIRMENFKGEQGREIIANGENVTISGRNGTGKSTIADAYFWAMTGKISDGSIGEVNSFDTDGKSRG